MERVVINPVQCIDKYQKDNQLMQSLMACGSGGSPHTVKPAHMHVVYEPIWIGQPWGLSYLRLKDAKEANLSRKGTKIIGASFPMRVVQDDPAQLQMIVARTDGLLFLSWWFYRTWFKANTLHWWMRAWAALAYHAIYTRVFTPMVVQIPQSNTGVHTLCATDVKRPVRANIQEGKFCFLNVGSPSSNKRRVCCVGVIPKMLRFVVVRADGWHLIPALWTLFKLRKNPDLLRKVQSESQPLITIEDRQPSWWQKLWPRPRAGMQ